jgi:hypothetical protein
MILEGFEIDHWSCIQHLAVHDLPSTGVIVLHGPNGTGKSSTIAALRACLMDFSAQATAKDLKRYFPKAGDEKPRVSVTFRAQGSSWRITKHFGTKVSKLERRTEAGTWTIEASSANDAHEQTRSLLGNKDSDQGLHQLLWLTQAEYQLPKPKEFDSDVQSQLRSVLGVMQTPLDDRFAQLVNEQWARWFSLKGKRKKESSLDRNLGLLAQRRSELDALNAEFQNMEKLLERSGDLDVVRRDLSRQLDDATRTRDALQAEYERSLKRIEAHHFASQRIETAEKCASDARAKRQRRTEAEEQVQAYARELALAKQALDEKCRQLELAEQQLRDVKSLAHSTYEAQREQHAKREAVGARQEALRQQTHLHAAREQLKHAETLHAEMETLKQQEREQPAPDTALLRRIEDNRTKAAKARTELDAAALALTLVTEPGASMAQVTIDGLAVLASSQHAVRRNVEITIPGWGRLQLSRGADARDIDQIETDLAALEREYSAAMAPFGIAAKDVLGLDRLRKLHADHLARKPALERCTAEWKRLAPQGMDPLRQQAAHLEKLCAAAALAFDERLPADGDALEQIAKQLKRDLDANDARLRDLEQQSAELDQRINGSVSKPGPKLAQPTGPSLRQQESSAREQYITLQTFIETKRGELDRMLTAEQIEHEIASAAETLQAARIEFEAAKLTPSEETIKDRLSVGKDAVTAVESELKEADKEFHNIAGVLSQTEGLHARRAALASQVEELTRLTDRETLECDATDRLRCLFEESRDKQLGSVLSPIHDRVLRWMKLLRISGYQSMRFNENFLPESLVPHHGEAEFAFCEESTGTIEQMALMVRLALGAALSTPSDPAVTVLDDPLTHSDVVRLNHMRAVLRSAAMGDTASAPPAGPLQILVFTCHPEWFRVEDARVIDLTRLP